MSKPIWERRPTTSVYVPVFVALMLAQWFAGWPL